MCVATNVNFQEVSDFLAHNAYYVETNLVHDLKKKLADTLTMYEFL